MAIGLLIRFVIDEFPDQAKFLTPEERQLVIDRIRADRGDATTEKLSWENLKYLKG